MSLHDDDDIRSLRSTRAVVAPPSAEALNRGRAALLERAARPVAQAAPTTARLRRARWALAGTAVAAVTAGALVLGNVTGFSGPQVAATAEAAQVLRSAAEATITAVDPVLEPGQYRLVTTESGQLVLGAGPGGDWGDSESFSGFSFRDHDELYIPADRADEWVWVREYGEPFDPIGPDGERRAAEYEQVDETVRAEAGAFYGVPARSGADLPTDGAALLQHFIDRDNGGSHSLEENLFENLVQLLRNHDASSELRAGVFEALTLIDGVAVTDDAAAVDGREGIAIGRHEPTRPTAEEIVFDATTGELLGSRSVTTEPYGPVPAGTVLSWTTVTTSVVDEAP